MPPHHTTIHTADTAVFSTLYLSAPDVVDLVRRTGIEACLRGIADNIHADFLRWESFDKSARVASHSRDGVIELMPVADEDTYAFKYVNGHPRNTRHGLTTVMAFGERRDSGSFLNLSRPRFSSSRVTSASWPAFLYESSSPSAVRT